MIEEEIETIIISPTMKFRQWRIAVTTAHAFYVGRSLDGHVVILDTFNRVPVPETDVMKAAKQDENIRDLSFLFPRLQVGGRYL